MGGPFVHPDIHLRLAGPSAVVEILAPGLHAGPRVQLVFTCTCLGISFIAACVRNMEPALRGHACAAVQGQGRVLRQW